MFALTKCSNDIICVTAMDQFYSITARAYSFMYLSFKFNSDGGIPYYFVYSYVLLLTIIGTPIGNSYAK